MSRLLLTAAAVLGLGLAAAAQEPAVIDMTNVPAPAPPPPQQQMLDLSLVEALVSVDAKDLTGVFGYVPEAASGPAFADYLIHNNAALKKFAKKCRKDLKEAGGINVWDRMVWVYVEQINSGPSLPPGAQKLSKSQDVEVSGFILAKPLSLQQLTGARGSLR